MDKQSTRKWVNGAAALTFSLVLLGFSSGLQMRSNIVNFVGSLLYIPEYPALTLRRTALELSGWFSGRDELIGRIERLSLENEKLRMLNAEIMTRKILAEIDGSELSAQVILRAPNAWWSEIRINMGAKNGLEIGEAVFKDGFLVGRIVSVDESSAWVELITSSSLMLPVVVDETRDIGVICGDGEGNVWLQFVPENRGIEKEMHVSTALVGDKLPPGLTIGQISGESSATPNGFRAYRIDIGANLSKLYAVDYKKTAGIKR